MHAHELSLFYPHPLERGPKFGELQGKPGAGREPAMDCQGLGSTHSHGYKMLGAFTALELLMAKQGGCWALTAQFAQRCHVVIYSLTSMRSVSLGLGMLADLPD